MSIDRATNSSALGGVLSVIATPVIWIYENIISPVLSALGVINSCPSINEDAKPLSRRVTKEEVATKKPTTAVETMKNVLRFGTKTDLTRFERNLSSDTYTMQLRALPETIRKQAVEKRKQGASGLEMLRFFEREI